MSKQRITLALVIWDSARDEEIPAIETNKL